MIYKINNFNPELEISYYIPCGLPCINERLRLEDLKTTTSLILNVQLLALPSYVDGKNSIPINAKAENARRLSYKNKGDLLGFNLKDKEFSNFEEGLNELKNKINNRKLCVVSGSSYFLHYSPNYQNEEFLNNYHRQIEMLGLGNHWLGVYGISSEKVLVYDPVPNKYIGSISMDNFFSFWKGNKEITQLKSIPGIEQLLRYGYRDIKVKEKKSLIEIKEKFLQTVKTVTYEYMNERRQSEENNTYYFGMLAVKKLCNLLASFNSQTSKDILDTYQTCLHQTKFSRYYFYELLKDMDNIFYKNYLDIYSNLKDIIEDWEKICFKFGVKLERNQGNAVSFNSLIKDFEQLRTKELNFYKNLLVSHEEYSLLKKEAKER